MDEIKTKKCSGECGQVKELSEFWVDYNADDGHNPQCSTCINKKRRDLRKEKKRLEDEKQLIFCKCCNVYKAANNFELHGSVCFSCKQNDIEMARFYKENGLKRCGGECRQLKPINEFGNDKNSKDGLNYLCKICKNKAGAESAFRHKETKRIKSAEWQRNNPEKVKAKKKRYRTKPENKKKIAKYNIAYEKRKIKNDPCFMLAKAARVRLNKAMREYEEGSKKAGSAVKDLGCTLEFFRDYIASLFQPGMTWENHGVFGWHLDHIVPLTDFNLVDREEFLRAVNYKNIQPLWANDNLTKNKY